MSLDDSESVDHEDVEEDNVEEDEVDEREEGNKSYLVKDEDLEGIKVECVEGDKTGSTWLLVADVFICHRYQSSYHDEDGTIKVSYMYKIDCPDCGQTKLWAIMQKFRNNLKQSMKDDYKIKFHNVINEEKKALNTISLPRSYKITLLYLCGFANDISK